MELYESSLKVGREKETQQGIVNGSLVSVTGPLPLKHCAYCMTLVIQYTPCCSGRTAHTLGRAGSCTHCSQSIHVWWNQGLIIDNKGGSPLTLAETTSGQSGTSTISTCSLELDHKHMHTHAYTTTCTTELTYTRTLLCSEDIELLTH